MSQNKMASVLYTVRIVFIALSELDMAFLE